MKNIRLVSSYARALLCIVGDRLDIIRKEVEFLLDFFKSQHDVLMCLTNPVLSAEYKKELVYCLKEYVSEDLIKFVVVICINKRFGFLLPILDEFLRLVEKDKNEFEITIKSAKCLTQSDIKIINESLEFIGKIVKVNNVVDPAILGGFIVRYGFYLIDASLRSYLERLADLSREEILKFNG
ncbi:MAG: ATP synthase F1 subunit delta [Wolbachia endosymbiont of Tyrophagus putrescentiae]|nr:ATP synthase F1 subunit delta [Wolbachia endosymbiont of Tyrophagus putrescentiae]